MAKLEFRRKSIPIQYERYVFTFIDGRDRKATIISFIENTVKILIKYYHSKTSMGNLF